jgi:hypothetical protein
MLVKLLLCTVCQFKHHSLLMMKDVLSNHQEYVCQRLQTRPQKEGGVSNRLFHKKIAVKAGMPTIAHFAPFF